jgi:hypothetical protein
MSIHFIWVDHLAADVLAPPAYGDRRANPAAGARVTGRTPDTEDAREVWPEVNDHCLKWLGLYRAVQGVRLFPGGGSSGGELRSGYLKVDRGRSYREAIYQYTFDSSLRVMLILRNGPIAFCMPPGRILSRMCEISR